MIKFVPDRVMFDGVHWYVSNKYDKNKEGRSYVKTSNIIKLEKNIRKLHRRLDNSTLSL